jgi:hypothetical protein
MSVRVQVKHLSAVAVAQINPVEDDWASWVITRAKEHGWRVHHARPARSGRGWRTPVQGDVGAPDLLLARAGEVLHVELKRGRHLPGPGAAGVAGCARPAWRGVASPGCGRGPRPPRPTGGRGVNGRLRAAVRPRVVGDGFCEFSPSATGSARFRGILGRPRLPLAGPAPGAGRDAVGAGHQPDLLPGPVRGGNHPDRCSPRRGATPRSARRCAPLRRVDGGQSGEARRDARPSRKIQAWSDCATGRLDRWPIRRPNHTTTDAYLW